MNCPDLTTLSAFFDRECSPPTHRAVEEHVASCADCRATLAHAAAARSQLRSLRTSAAPARLRLRVCDSLDRARPSASPARCAAAAIVGCALFWAATGGFEPATPRSTHSGIERHLHSAAPLFAGTGSDLLAGAGAALLEQLRDRKERR